MALLVLEGGNDTEVKVASLLDAAVNEVSLNSDNDYMEISRHPDFEWKLCCDKNAITRGSTFICDVNVGKIKVAFVRRKVVCVIEMFTVHLVLFSHVH